MRRSRNLRGHDGASWNCGRFCCCAIFESRREAPYPLGPAGFSGHRNRRNERLRPCRTGLGPRALHSCSSARCRRRSARGRASCAVRGTWRRCDRALGRTQDPQFHGQPPVVVGVRQIKRPNPDVAHNRFALAKRCGNALAGSSRAVPRSCSQCARFSCIRTDLAAPSRGDGGPCVACGVGS